MPATPRKVILAIDLGTSGPKVALVAVGGTVLGHEFEPVELLLLPGGGAEQRPGEWWTAITTAARRLLGRGLVDPAEADAVVDPDAYDEGLDFEFVSDVGGRLLRRYPAMEQGESTGGYASLYAVTPDWHPVIDEVPAGSGFFVCSGFSGHGFKLGPAVGVMVAEMLTGVSKPRFDPRFFRFSRYAENDPVRGQYEYSIAG